MTAVVNHIHKFRTSNTIQNRRGVVDVCTQSRFGSMSDEFVSALNYFPPMGVYETLFRFQDSTGKYMGSEGTHPWAQGFPLTSPLPNGPSIPTSVSYTHIDMKYPQATGQPELLDAVSNYYRHFYGADIDRDNVAIFAGGRPGIYATLAFLQAEYTVLVEETEYTPYYDALQLLKRRYKVIQSNPENHFRPTAATYASSLDPDEKAFILKSNPCNPTGVATTGDSLQALVDFCSGNGRGGLFDEAYEFFHSSPESAMKYVPNINHTNIFVIGAVTKGLQAPGLRLGWVIASKRNIELFRNFSSIAMGGVSRLSQIAATALLDINRVVTARQAVAAFYGSQREKYGQALQALGLELFTGDGGFYHWCRLPAGLTCSQFNERLFKHEAAILPGTLCDMFRRGEDGPMGGFIRFSFGPLPAESFNGDIEILRACLKT
jgi:aspartate/methionine/tyrosine aminotransferase